METGQTIGGGINESGLSASIPVGTEVVRDHTGARHVFPVYDAGKAYRDALADRETKEAPRTDVPWTDWNGTMRGKERG
ncbi:MAG: hypothetical protein HYW63_02950 [Candidatus Levybacteria bacterium]|nr:hypothetical protein [Candidatus Levybacteria bacterium]